MNVMQWKIWTTHETASYCTETCQHNFLTMAGTQGSNQPTRQKNHLGMKQVSLSIDPIFFVIISNAACYHLPRMATTSSEWTQSITLCNTKAAGKSLMLCFDHQAKQESFSWSHQVHLHENKQSAEGQWAIIIHYDYFLWSCWGLSYQQVGAYCTFLCLNLLYRRRMRWCWCIMIMHSVHIVSEKKKHLWFHTKPAVQISSSVTLHSSQKLQRNVE